MTSKKQLAPDRLMAAIHGNDPAAFRELYGCYLSNLRHGVRSLLLRVPRLRPYEEEIISRAWIRLLANERKLLRSYDPERASFATFMSMVGANTAWQVAALKKHPTHAWSGEFDDETPNTVSQATDMETILADRQLLKKVLTALRDALTEREWVILEEIIIAQRPAAEVAHELNVSAQVVWAATSRLRKKLEKLAVELLEGVLPPDEKRNKLDVLLMLLSLLGPGMATLDPGASLSYFDGSQANEDPGP